MPYRISFGEVDMQVCMDDIDCHTYQEISTIPAIKLDDTTNPTVRLVAEEMVRFKKEVRCIFGGYLLV